VAAGLAATIASPVRRARAMIVIIGLVPLDVGNALASPLLLLCRPSLRGLRLPPGS
jgi:hypothetical protein